jgi:HEAT repeat protein
VGTFSVTDVVGRLIARLSDADDNVARQAAAALLAQPDRKLVQRLVEEAAAKHSDIVAQSRAKSLLTKTRE